MSRFEIFIIAMFCAIPVIALIAVFPKIKFKKKAKKTVEPTKTYSEIKQEEKHAEQIVEEVKPKEVKMPIMSDEISSDDFRSYLEQKKKDVSKPKRIELPSDFKDMSMPFAPRRRVRNQKPKNISEEIQSLSPELKAMLIAGVLDKKDYD